MRCTISFSIDNDDTLCFNIFASYVLIKLSTWWIKSDNTVLSDAFHSDFSYIFRCFLIRFTLRLSLGWKFHFNSLESNDDSLSL